MEKCIICNKKTKVFSGDKDEAVFCCDETEVHKFNICAECWDKKVNEGYISGYILEKKEGGNYEIKCHTEQ